MDFLSSETSKPQPALYFHMMCSRLLAVLPLIFLFASGAAAQAPDGIPRELARQRAAEISGLRYRLSFSLVPLAPSAAGTEEIRFNLRTRLFSPAARLSRRHNRFTLGEWRCRSRCARERAHRAARVHVCDRVKI